MKKILLFTLAAVLTLGFVFPGAWAQESATDEFTLEEITVTAEKREVNVQDIPASVYAIGGADLVTQGKVTVAQMLENVPNLKYGQGGRGFGPNSNITIRGVKKTQQPGGPNSFVAPASSNYVDGVYDGSGGNFDIERIEVLRGPQGTLYGRAAAGGVVSFHTKDPKLEAFSGNVFAEYGTASRINAQGAVNVPLGDKVALRAAVHYFNQDEDYWAGEGVESETKEGRIKVLYQPTEKFSAILSVMAGEDQTYAGGWTQYLPEPNTVIEEGVYVETGKNAPQKNRQYSLEVNYDLGDSALSYIAAYHTRDNRGPGAIGFNRGSLMSQVRGGEPTETDYHELRWTSDAEGPFTWLIGASYYGFSWNNTMTNTQVSVVEFPDMPGSQWAPIFSENMKGSIDEFGIFTEETFELRDDMRITAGLRYDKNEIKDYPAMGININVAPPPTGASLNPPVWVQTPYIANIVDFDNTTYKLRFEYDVTPENMLYVSTGTGYIPGMSSFGPQFIGGFPPTGVNFVIQPFNQQKVTSYELGSKNRFLDNRLQLNGALFYTDYEGYQEAVNIDPGGPPPPTFQILPIPVIMKGLELDGTWLLSAYDKIKLSLGWLDAQIDEFPALPGSIYNTEDLMYLKRLPGLPEVTAVLEYDHTFLFDSGASLVPRIEAHYTSDHYVQQVTRVEAEDQGLLPYVKQDATVLFNLGATWTSPQNKFSVIAYVRNASDEQVKTSVQTSMGQGTPHGVQLGDPQTFGVMLSANF